MAHLDSENIYVAGHRGLVGAAICRRLAASGVVPLVADRNELDLTDQRAVLEFFERHRVSHVYLAAARVGGVLANSQHPASFLRDNLSIALNVIESARKAGVSKLLFLGSSCVYPLTAKQPIDEQALLTGPLEQTNQWYALAKIAGLKLCQAYYQQYAFKSVCLMPANVYGPDDNFRLDTAHVIPALVRKFERARIENLPEVEVWGDGNAKREFLYVDDLADASLFLMERLESGDLVNVGSGIEVSVAQLAELIRKRIGFEGKIRFNDNRPVGVARRMLDSSRLQKLGWHAKTSLDEGIEQTVRWFRSTSDREKRI